MSRKAKKVETEKVYRKKLIKRRKPNRSIVGDIFLYLFLLFIAFVMAFPIIYAVSSALKPLDELFKFPPKVFPQNPTLDNFSDLFVTMGKSWVTFSRYLSPRTKQTTAPIPPRSTLRKQAKQKILRSLLIMRTAPESCCSLSTPSTRWNPIR